MLMEEFTLEFYLGGDWKFLTLCTAIEAASSTYFCVWCKCPSDSKHVGDTWSALETQKGRSNSTRDTTTQ